MQNKLLSIIIPVYNSEKFLERCLLSVQNQTYTNFECLLINDGSSDNSATIIERFSKTDNRFIAFHTENKGPSQARNTGLSNVKGEYIGFVDSDDWIELDMYEKMIQSIEAANADICICDVYVHSDTNNKDLRLRLKDDILDTSVCRDKEIINLFRFRYDYANWNKLFRRQLINQNNIKFNITIGRCEDLLFNYFSFLKASKICTLSTPFYHYIIHPQSITQTETSHILDEIIKFNIIATEHYKNNLNTINFILLQKETGRLFLYHLFIATHKILNQKRDTNDTIKSLKNLLKRFENEGILCYLDFSPYTFYQKIKIKLLKLKLMNTFIFLEITGHKIKNIR